MIELDRTPAAAGADEEERQMRIGWYVATCAVAQGGDAARVGCVLLQAAIEGADWLPAALLLLSGREPEDVARQLRLSRPRLLQHTRRLYRALGRAFPDGYKGFHGQAPFPWWIHREDMLCGEL